MITLGRLCLGFVVALAAFEMTGVAHAQTTPQRQIKCTLSGPVQTLAIVSSGTAGGCSGGGTAFGFNFDLAQFNQLIRVPEQLMSFQAMIGFKSAGSTIMNFYPANNPKSTNCDTYIDVDGAGVGNDIGITCPTVSAPNANGIDCSWSPSNLSAKIVFSYRDCL